MKSMGAHLLRQLRGLHPGLDNLQSDQMSGGLVAFESFGLEANGEAAFAQLVGGGIVDPVRFRDYRRRRLRVDRHV